MIHVVKYTVISLVITTFLCACSKDATSVAPAGVAASAAKVEDAASLPALNISSPDNAVKSWWSYIDFRIQEEFEFCQSIEKTKKFKHVEMLPKVAQSEALKAITPKPTECEKESYSRDIQEVKTESETRAIVFAVVRNNTPIPPGAVPDEMDKKWRDNGFKFKYLVEKSSDGWKVSQVYKFDKFKAEYGDKDGWEKEYTYSETPSYPSYVHKQ